MKPSNPTQYIGLILWLTLKIIVYLLRMAVCIREKVPSLRGCSASWGLPEGVQGSFKGVDIRQVLNLEMMRLRIMWLFA